MSSKRKRLSFMYLARKIQNILRRLLRTYGTKNVKGFLWNIEFSRGRRDCLERKPGYCMYPHVERREQDKVNQRNCQTSRTGHLTGGHRDPSLTQEGAGVWFCTKIKLKSDIPAQLH